MSTTHNFQPVFNCLRDILKPYESDLTITQDTADFYSLDGHYSQKFKKNLFFGSVQIKKNYVSFYLMPVYMYPEMLDTISPELKKRMQGKSCFNFKKVGEVLFEELAALVSQGYERFQKQE
jgi:hypothetical protein